MDIKEILTYIVDSGVLEILGSLGVLVASGVAIWGINSWRREAKWKRKYEIAEEVLACIYESHQALKAIRSPFGYEGEGSSRPKKDNEDPKETKIRNQAYSVRERYERNKEPFEKLYSLKFRFIALYGKEYEKYFDHFQIALNHIFFAADQIAANKLGDYLVERDEIKEHRKVLYANLTREDPFDDEISQAVKKIEDKCRSIIGKIN